MFLAYVRTIATNLVIDNLRGKKVIFEELDPSLRDPQPGVRPELELTDTIDRHIEVCSGTNARRDRRIFWLYYRSGLTSKAIAALPQIGLQQKGVESLLLRLCRCIRRAMAEGIPRPNSFQEGESSIGNAI